MSTKTVAAPKPASISRSTITASIMYVILTAIAIYTLFPLLFVLTNSFKSQSEIVSTPLAMPSSWNFKYIANAIESIKFFQSISLTIFITVAAIILLVIVASLVSWMMVRNHTKFSNFLFMAFTAAMLIPFQSVMYPLISLFDKSGLKNIPGLIIMYGGFGLSLSVFLYHGFIKSVPKTIEEAALIDGASVGQLFFLVVLPLLKNTTVTVIILNAMWVWNDFLLPFLVIGNQPVKTLTLALYFQKLTSGQYGNPWELIFPAVFVTIIPIVFVFLFLQKYIMKGVAAGAVKE
jgi:raffinose/stachyose/melibiose transport system permease protein